MAEGVPRERRATTCRSNGSERRPADPTVDLQKQITVLADAISRMGVLLSTLMKQVVDDENIRASQQQFVRGCEQRRDVDDRGYSPRYMQPRRHNDTVMRVVVVTIVGSSAISGENVRDFGNSRMNRREGVGIRETCRRYTLPVVLRRTYTEDAPRVVDRTTQRHSDTRWQHVRCVKAREPTGTILSRNALSPINREHMRSATLSAIPIWISRRDAGELHPRAALRNRAL